ncbi:hypothetical protein RCL1_007829 [Eukaryota sp. TZLM3-RCL]
MELDPLSDFEDFEAWDGDSLTTSQLDVFDTFSPNIPELGALIQTFPWISECSTSSGDLIFRISISLNSVLSHFHRKLFKISDPLEIHIKFPNSSSAPILHCDHSLPSSYKIICDRVNQDINLRQDLYSNLRPSSLCSEIGFNFFLFIHDSILSTVSSLTQRCATCHEYLDVPLGPKLTYCQKPLCQFSCLEHGIGISVHDELMKNPEVVELLLSFACAALTHNKHELYFANIPSDYINGPNYKDYAKLVSDLRSIPPVLSMLQKTSNDSDLIKDLGMPKYRLLRWILASNRSFYAHVPKTSSLYIQGLGGVQFLLSSVDPLRESNFQALCKNFGHIWAFHGSKPNCWWNILGCNQSLINASNTKYMTAGAAYGAGIYFSTTPSTASGYGQFVPRNSSLPSGNAVLMCQIAKTGNSEFTSWSKGNTVYVVPKEHHVCPRYLIIGPNVNYSPASNLPSEFSSESVLSGLEL